MAPFFCLPHEDRLETSRYPYPLFNGDLPVKTVAIYILAAIAEIGGCFAFWTWLRLGRSPLGGFVGTVSLVIFGVLLTRSETAFAGRAFAAYGGVYIAASLLWLFVVERVVPDRWDIISAGICLVGAGLILWGPRQFIH